MSDDDVFREGGAFSEIASLGIVPVLTVERSDRALGLADALQAGGLPVAEITFRTAAAADVLRLLSRERPDLILGAGTILTPESAALAAECGARFLVAPGFQPAVVRRARELGLPMVPGIQTPTELEQAMAMGCRVLKVFPAELAGGIRLIQALAAPYRHTGVRFLPTGGITVSSLPSYLGEETVLAVGGTWIAKKEDIDEGRWDAVQARCREALDIVARVRGAR